MKLTLHSAAGILLSVSTCALVPGCTDKSNTNGSALTADVNTNIIVIATDHTNADLNADNSRLNERDRTGRTLTPGDQGNIPADLELTQRIRKALVDSTNSMNAKNIKIITVNGQVTLRGSVYSASERLSIEALSKNIAGEDKVDDQLEIKSNP